MCRRTACAVDFRSLPGKPLFPTDSPSRLQVYLLDLGACVVARVLQLAEGQHGCVCVVALVPNTRIVCVCVCRGVYCYSRVALSGAGCATGSQVRREVRDQVLVILQLPNRLQAKAPSRVSVPRDSVLRRQRRAELRLEPVPQPSGPAQGQLYAAATARILVPRAGSRVERDLERGVGTVHLVLPDAGISDG